MGPEGGSKVGHEGVQKGGPERVQEVSRKGPNWVQMGSTRGPDWGGGGGIVLYRLLAGSSTTKNDVQ